MELTCPKCHGTMRTYERNGVHVDQCSDCRGIFLDRGELDRLIDAESAVHDGPAQRPDPSHRPSTQQHGMPSAAGLGGVVSEVLRQVQGSGHSSSHAGYGKPHKKKSLMSELFG
jgi:Zn-finger nucleic acid-binding protein